MCRSDDDHHGRMASPDLSGGPGPVRPGPVTRPARRPPARARRTPPGESVTVTVRSPQAGTGFNRVPPRALSLSRVRAAPPPGPIRSGRALTESARAGRPSSAGLPADPGPGRFNGSLKAPLSQRRGESQTMKLDGPARRRGEEEGEREEGEGRGEEGE
eukprot:50817-Hanusia_phi.AAC.2